MTSPGSSLRKVTSSKPTVQGQRARRVGDLGGPPSEVLEQPQTGGPPLLLRGPWTWRWTPLIREVPDWPDSRTTFGGRYLTWGHPRPQLIQLRTRLKFWMSDFRAIRRLPRGLPGARSSRSKKTIPATGERTSALHAPGEGTGRREGCT